MNLDDIIDLFFENIKQLYLPDSFLQLDMKFSKSELLSMVLIDKRQEITMTELSDYISTPMSTANGIIERLVKKGYISRERSEADRRIVVLKLTPDGAKLIAWMRDYVSVYLKMALEDLSGDEIQTLISIIMKIVRSLQNKMSQQAIVEAETIRSISIE
jgi:DNA-binding MarR family transcriptional regulator